MYKFPDKWYLIITEDNIQICDKWRKDIATSHLDRGLKVGFILLSKHHDDDSYFYARNLDRFKTNSYYKDYVEITTELFKRYVLKQIPDDWNIEVETKEQFDEVCEFLLKPNYTGDKFWLQSGRGFNGGARFIKKYNSSEGFIYDDTDNNYPIEKRISWKEFQQIKMDKQLPNKWCILITKDNLDILNQYLKENKHKYPAYSKYWKVYLDNEESWFYSESDINNKYAHSSVVLYKEFTLITTEQLLKYYNLKTNKMEDRKIVGYKLKDNLWVSESRKNLFLKGVCNIGILHIENPSIETINNVMSSIIPDVIGNFTKAGVLDLWFSPVYEQQFKIGDWVYIENCEDGALGALHRVGQITDKKATDGKSSDYPNGIKVNINGRIWTIGKDFNSVKLRLATPEEIKTVQTKTLVLGDKGIKITIGKNSIEAENKVISIEAINALHNYLTNSFDVPGLPWSCKFTSNIKIGCSYFSEQDLSTIIKTYEEINN